MGKGMYFWKLKGTTIMIPSFRTDRSGQTVQTQIRLLLEEEPSVCLIRVYTVCNSVCILWVHYSLVKPSCSNFRVTTANFSGVQIFRTFIVSRTSTSIFSKNNASVLCFLTILQTSLIVVFLYHLDTHKKLFLLLENILKVPYLF